VALDLQLMDLNVSLPTGQFGDFGGGLGGEMGGVGVDWGTVSLSELDALPVVKRANVLATMSRLNRELRGDSIEVMFHIVIDENGKVHPVRILESSHPQFNAEMMAFAATVEFTPPTVLGLPVRTEYRWPVKLDAKRGCDETVDTDCFAPVRLYAAQRCGTRTEPAARRVGAAVRQYATVAEGGRRPAH